MLIWNLLPPSLKAFFLSGYYKFPLKPYLYYVLYFSEFKSFITLTQSHQFPWGRVQQYDAQREQIHGPSWSTYEHLKIFFSFFLVMEYNSFSKMPPSLSEKQKAKNKHANKAKISDEQTKYCLSHSFQFEVLGKTLKDPQN